MILRQMSRPNFDEELRGFLNVYNRALPGSWGFVPISEAEMDHMAAGMRHLIVPDLTGVVEVDGKRAGVTFGMLDYNERIRKIDGMLFPFGFLRLLLWSGVLWRWDDLLLDCSHLIMFTEVKKNIILGFGGIIETESQKEKIKDNWFVNPFRYGARATIGWDFFDLFFNYDLTELFEDDITAPRLNPVTFGVIF